MAKGCNAGMKPIEPKLKNQHHKWLQIGSSIRDTDRSDRAARDRRRRAARYEGSLMVRDPPEDVDVSKLSLYDNEGIG
jgi:hypothetical protein